MASVKCEGQLSEMEPLPPSSPPSHPLLTLSNPSPFKQAHSSSDLYHSCPSSPHPLLDESHEVTARLYSSLQLSRNQVNGHPFSDHSNRHMSFQFSSPWLKGKQGRNESRLSPNHYNPSPGWGQNKEGEKEEEIVDVDFHLWTCVDYSNRQTNGKRHIQDMEKIRANLQTMFRSTARLGTEGSSCGTESANNHSFNSDSTSHLLGVTVGDMEELFPRSSCLHFDGVLSPETAVLRENLDRERNQRKQYEGQVLVLQSKAVELQQRLSLAVSADRKKDIMIEQLDKTLAKVVEGWTKHDHEQSEGVRRLLEEKKLAEQRHTLLQETLHQLERSLSQASESLEQAQKRSNQLQRTNRQLELRLVELDASLCDSRFEVERVCGERDELCMEQDRLRLQAQEAQSALTRFQEKTANERRLLEDKTVQLTYELQEERECKQREEQHLVEVIQKLEEANKSLQQLEEDREEAERERDADRMKRVLEQARVEAQCSQLEMELTKATEGLFALQQEQNALKEQHRKQLLELSICHQRELSSQLQQQQQRIHTLTQDFQTRLAHFQQRCVLLKESKKKLEGHREELVGRLQSLQHSHWTEALRLLSTKTEKSSLCFLWDESKDRMNQYLGLEPSSSAHITSQCRAAVHTHTTQKKHDGEEACLAKDLCDRGEDLTGWMGEQQEDVQRRDGSGERQQWAESGTCLTSDPRPSHGPIFDPGRRSELEYYVSMLLDRSPGKPVESTTQDSAGLQLSNDNGKSQPQSPVDTTSVAKNQTNHSQSS